jgi:DNA (cytosine-5)-methyltransferase 1
MFSPTKILRYAVGQKDNGNRRVYIQNHEDLTSINFLPHSRFSVQDAGEEIVLTLDNNGGRKVYESKRGDSIVELSDKIISNFIGKFARYVTVKLVSNKIHISRYRSELQREKREGNFLKNINSNMILTASLYSGVGHLSYCMHQGLREAGFSPRIIFANEIDPTAARINAVNPIWASAAKDALLMVDDIQTLDMSLLPSYVDHLEIALPCTGQSKLISKSKRDILHPVTGKLFIKTLEAITKINPATLTIECTPGLLKSVTYLCIEDFLKKSGYSFQTTTLKGTDFGGFEVRERFCLFAVSKGLEGLFPNIERVDAYHCKNEQTFKDIKDDIADDSILWKEYNHVKKRDKMKNGYRNVLVLDDDNQMPAIVASYSAPKAGSPFCPHPSNSNLQRQLTVNEHNKIREFPDAVANAILKLSKGLLPGQTRTNVTAAHKLGGNSVSPRPWRALMFHMFSGLNTKNNNKFMLHINDSVD